MSKTLYRTYRPQNFSDVIGQDVIVKTLQNAIKQNRIGHAYLFTGPRGTGKTTIARLFAVAINIQERKGFEPVSKQVAQHLMDGDCMDIIEIDAASNTGVDDIRTLKENVNITPSEAKFKVYIIDEVHMLSTSAFNALLKTLEEPPSHAVFILATTEIQKVPSTIISRCQRFDFTRFNTEEIIKKLTFIAKTENVEITPEALEQIAIAADGGMRDAESLLEQIFALENKKVTEQTVAEILGTTTQKEVMDLLDAFVKQDITKALTTITNVVHNGYNIEAFIKMVIEKSRVLLFLSLSNTDKNIRNLVNIPKSELSQLKTLSSETTTDNIVHIIEECVSALQKTKNTTIPQLPIEVASVNICGTKITPKTKNKKDSKQMTQDKGDIDSSNNSITNKQSQSNIKSTQLKKWDDSINKISEINTTLGKLLAQCKLIDINNNKIILQTKFEFHKDKILQNDNRKLIETVLQKEFDKNMNLEIKIKAQQDAHSSELLNYAKQLMGGTVTE